MFVADTLPTPQFIHKVQVGQTHASDIGRGSILWIGRRIRFVFFHLIEM
jgi:hypothetical protein